MALTYKLILASGSPRRVDLLAQAGIEPSRLMPMDLDETPKQAGAPAFARQAPVDGKGRSGACRDQGRPCLGGQLHPCRRHGGCRRPPHSRQGRIGRARLRARCICCPAAATGSIPASASSRPTQDPPEGHRDQGALQAAFRPRDRELSCVRPVARQGGRLRHPGHRRQLCRKMVGSYTNVVGLPLYETVPAAHRRRLSTCMTAGTRAEPEGGSPCPKKARRLKGGAAAQGPALPGMRQALAPRALSLLLGPLPQCRSQPLAQRFLCDPGRRR